MANFSIPPSIPSLAGNRRSHGAAIKPFLWPFMPLPLQSSPDELKTAILLFYGLLDEQQRRLFAGLESIRLVPKPVDGRKGIDSLAQLCREKLAEDQRLGQSQLLEIKP